jgi:hypothetical protein
MRVSGAFRGDTIGLMPRASAVDPIYPGQVRTRPPEGVLAAIAERQHGVVSRRQLEDLGFSKAAIDHRVGACRLRLIHRGVYAVGHRLLNRRGHWLAAVLAGGEGAVLSHRSAAELHGILPASQGPAHVTTPRKTRTRPGLVFHRAGVPVDEVAVIDGIPATGVSRTILDLGASVRRELVDRALHEAEVLRLAEALSLDELLLRYPGRPGTAVVRDALGERRIGDTAARSELEDAFATLIARYGLPRPEINANVSAGGWVHEVDCVWRRERVGLELDGRATHATVRAFERDRERDRRLQAAGWRIVRVTWRQLRDQPAAVAADIRSLLSQSPRVRT